MNRLFCKKVTIKPEDENKDSTPPTDSITPFPGETPQSANSVESSQSPLSKNQKSHSKITSYCEKCGACCAFFLVSFPSIETDPTCAGSVPLELTQQLDELKSFMRGTKGKMARCIALEGMVGFKVKCTVYENRPSCCREFSRSWENDTGNQMCDKARAAYMLEPFSRF